MNKKVVYVITIILIALLGLVVYYNKNCEPKYVVLIGEGNEYLDNDCSTTR